MMDLAQGGCVTCLVVFCKETSKSRPLQQKMKPTATTRSAAKKRPAHIRRRRFWANIEVKYKTSSSSFSWTIFLAIYGIRAGTHWCSPNCGFSRKLAYRPVIAGAVLETASFITY